MTTGVMITFIICVTIVLLAVCSLIRNSIILHSLEENEELIRDIVLDEIESIFLNGEYDSDVDPSDPEELLPFN